MQSQNEIHNFGPILERTLKIIRQNVLQIFRDLNLDITTEQWVILDSLYHQDGQAQRELAQGNHKNAATLSRIIDLMCKKGMVERRRSEADKRSYSVFLTKTGKAIHKKAYPKILDLRKQGWSQLSPADFAHFKRIMNQLYANFEKEHSKLG